MKAQHLKSKAISTLLVMRHPEVGSKFGGIWVDQNKNVVGFGKDKPPGAVEGFHFLGIQILNQKILGFIEDNLEQNILYQNLAAALKAGHTANIYEITGHWYETGNLIDYLEATRDVLTKIQNNTPEYHQVSQFLKKWAPNSSLETISDCIVWRDQSSQISNCQFKDFAVIGPHVKIQNSSIQSSVIYKGSALDRQNYFNSLIL